jgi:hypothetical protein
MSDRIEFRDGGNPPIGAGLFSVPDQQGRRGRRVGEITRLAFWPASVEPNDLNIQRVMVELVWKRDDESQPITREQIMHLINGKAR